MNGSASLKLKMFVAGALTIMAEAFVVYFIASFFNFPIYLAFIFLALFWLFQWLIAPYAIGRNSVEVKEGDIEYGWLYNMVRDIARESRTQVPRVYISNEPFPNAFAFGNFITGKRIAITRPLLEILNDDELMAVIGHEVGHIKHLDVEIGTALGLIPAVLGFISNLLLNLGWAFLIFAGSEADLIAGLIMLSIGGVIFIITFILQIFVLWLNRLRESFADLHSITLFKEKAINLATALAKIQVYMQNVSIDPFRGIVVTLPPMKIKEKNPNELLERWLNEKVSPLSDILMTHPHPAKRIQAIFKSVKQYEL